MGIRRIKGKPKTRQIPTWVFKNKRDGKELHFLADTNSKPQESMQKTVDRWKKSKVKSKIPKYWMNIHNWEFIGQREATLFMMSSSV